jgi:hypothetical protein
MIEDEVVDAEDVVAEETSFSLSFTEFSDDGVEITSDTETDILNIYFYLYINPNFE